MIIFFPNTDEMLKYVGQKIIYILFFLRNVVTPLLLPMNNYKLGIVIKNQADIDFSIFLMLYETFMVFLVLTQKFRLFKGKESNKKSFLNRCIFKQKPFDFILILLTILTLILWIVVPELRKSYESIFNLSDLIQVANNVVKDDLSSSTRALATIGGILLTFCRLFVTLWLLYKIRMRSSNAKTGILVALVLAFLQMLFIGAQLMFGKRQII